MNPLRLDSDSVARRIVERLGAGGALSSEAIVARLVEQLRSCDEARDLFLGLAGDGAAEGAEDGDDDASAACDKVDCQKMTAFMDLAAWIAGRVAHDFGNFLTGILGFTELALIKVDADSTAHRYLKEVWQSARLGADWVHELQMFGRRTAAVRAPCPLAPVVAEQEAVLRSRLCSGTALRVTLARGLPMVAIDHDSLRQALGHLLANALEALPAQGGEVQLTARAVQLDEEECGRWLGLPRPGPAVEIDIADTGVGLAEVRDKLFRELFFSTKPRHRGLGLAVTYGIVRAYQGGLRLEDRAPRGARARVVLPAAAATAADPTTDNPGTALVRARILIVDDDAVVAGAARATLKSAGFTVAEASGPEAAFEAVLDAYAQGSCFDLVISDVIMPGLNGYELARRLRACAPTTRFLFISSQIFGASAAPDPSLGPVELLSKPFVARELLLAVSRALGKEGAVPVPARKELP